MARPPGVRWDRDAWVAEVGEPWVDSRGRKRRREVRFPFGKGEREAALRAMLTYRDQQRAVEADPGAGITVEGLCQGFLQSNEASAAPRTHTSYVDILRIFLRWQLADGTLIGSLPARQFEPSHLQAVLDGMAGNSPHYRDRMQRSVKRVWSWGHAVDRNRSPEQVLRFNPLSGMKRVRIPKSPERYLERSLVERFLRFTYWTAKRRGVPAGRAKNRHCGPRGQTLLSRFDRLAVLMIRFIRMTGCRPDEAARATWDELNLDRGTLTIRGKSTHATGDMRVIYLTPRLKRMLRAIEALPGRHPTHIFTHLRGKYADARGATDPLAGEPWKGKAIQDKLALFRDQAIAAGLPIEAKGNSRFVLYTLRHTRISDDLMAGGDLASVAKIHGTSPAMISKVYGHLLTDHLARLNDELAERARKKR